MNPENPTYNPEDEADDSPYSETNQQREQYKANLAKQLKNNRTEDELPKRKDNVISAQDRFKQAPAKPQMVVPDHIEITKKAVQEYRKRQFIKDLRESGEYDAYLHMSQEEKDHRFEEWKSNLKR